MDYRGVVKYDTPILVLYKMGYKKPIPRIAYCIALCYNYKNTQYEVVIWI